MGPGIRFRPTVPAVLLGRLALVAIIACSAPKALGRPGHAQDVRDECARAGHPNPDFPVNDCNVCHRNANNKQAYLSGNFLDVLCQVRASPPVSGNTAPHLEHLGPQNLVVGRTFRLAVAASDAEDDRLSLSARPLPAGTRFRGAAKRGGKWAGLFLWRPRASQAGRTFTIRFAATETSRVPGLGSTEDVLFFVSRRNPAGSLRIEQSRYESGILNVAGTVEGPAIRKDAALTRIFIIRTAAGRVLGAVDAANGGAWSVAVPLAADEVPCRILAEMDGQAVAVEAVKSREADCR